MPTSHYNTALLSNFHGESLTALSADALGTITTLTRSIHQFGLLTPLSVIQRGEKFIVADGKKRLAALRRLQQQGRLARDLVRVPYVLCHTETADCAATHGLMSNYEQFRAVMALQAKGRSIREISTALFMPKNCVLDILSLETLSVDLQRAFFSGTLNLRQARAFATIDNPEAQNALLLVLGPFAYAPDIIAAIYKGDTVINLPHGHEDSIIILPSRRPIPPEVGFSQAA